MSNESEYVPLTRRGKAAKELAELDRARVRAELRAHFAGLAMQGMGNWVPNADHGPFNWDSPEEVCRLKARWAISQADALLAELEKSA